MIIVFFSDIEDEITVLTSIYEDDLLITKDNRYRMDVL